MSDVAPQRGDALDELERFFELSVDLLAIASYDGCFERLSPSWERVLGYSLDELMSRSFLELIHPEDRPATLVEARRLAQGEETVEFENRYRCKDGSYRWLRWNARLWRPGRRFYAVARETTERKRLEGELAQARDQALAASRLKSDLLEGVAGQLWEPLRQIVARAERMTQPEVAVAEQLVLAEAVRRTGASLLEALQTLTEYTLLERNRVDLHAAEVSLREWVAEAFELFEERARALGIGLQWRVDAALPERAVFDALRVQQVLAQVLTHALESTHEGGVTVALLPGSGPSGGARLRIVAVDTGIGMSAERLEELFEPRPGTEGGATGVRFGLGLAVAKRLVDLMGGTVEARSMPGMGSTVAVSVPIVPVGPGTSAAAEPAAPSGREANVSQEEGASSGAVRDDGEGLGAPPPQARPARLLLVESHPVRRKQLDRLLQEEGYQVLLAGSGVEAVDLFCRQDVDLVLLDVELPEMDGYATAQELRARQRERRPVPVVALAPQVGPQDRARCLEAGMDDVVSRRAHADELMTAVRRLLGRAPQRLAAQREARGGEAPVDLTRIRDAADGEHEFERELIRLFVADLQRHLSAMGEALSAGDFVEIRRRAHSIKGAAAHIGAVFICELAAELENGSGTQTSESSRAQLARLESEFDRARAYLEGYLSNLERGGA